MNSDKLLNEVNTENGYYLKNKQRLNSDSLLLVLSFSGGGTRAAALSYGVLKALSDIQVTIDNEPRRLIDEIDIITSVSGGSFTSAYYGLFKDKIFIDFEDKFLKKNIQANLYAKLFNPFNWPKLASSKFNRADLASQYYDKHLFNHATFKALQRPDTPFILINATQVSSETMISFEQRQFDMFCIDISNHPVARAVMASSAVPLLFPPITYKNKSGQCDNKLPRWARQALQEKQINTRLYNLATKYQHFRNDEKNPYVHLYDGVLTDNLGLKSIINLIERTGGAWQAFKVMGHENVKKAVVIVVDAKLSAASRTSKRPNITLSKAATSAFSVTINSLTNETKRIVRNEMAAWNTKILTQRCWALSKQGKDQKGCYEFKNYLIEVDPEMIDNQHERDYFNDIPTSFNLSSKQVDFLVTTGGKLVNNSPAFNQFLNELNND